MLFLNWHQFCKATNVDLDVSFGCILKQYCTLLIFLLHPVVVVPQSTHVIPATSNFPNVCCVLGVFFQINTKSVLLLSFKSFAFLLEKNFGKRLYISSAVSVNCSLFPFL